MCTSSQTHWSLHYWSGDLITQVHSWDPKMIIPLVSNLGSYINMCQSKNRTSWLQRGCQAARRWVCQVPYILTADHVTSQTRSHVIHKTTQKIESNQTRYGSQESNIHPHNMHLSLKIALMAWFQKQSVLVIQYSLQHPGSKYNTHYQIPPHAQLKYYFT